MNPYSQDAPPVTVADEVDVVRPRNSSSFVYHLRDATTPDRPVCEEGGADRQWRTTPVGAIRSHYNQCRKCRYEIANGATAITTPEVTDDV